MTEEQVGTAQPLQQRGRADMGAQSQQCPGSAEHRPGCKTRSLVIIPPKLMQCSHATSPCPSTAHPLSTQAGLGESMGGSQPSELLSFRRWG